MHHFRAKKTVAHFAARANAITDGKLLGLAAVKVQKAQHQLTGIVGNRHHQLSPRPILNVAGCDPALDLSRISSVKSCLAYGYKLRLILITQGQMQRQIDVSAQAKTGELAGGSGLGFGNGLGGTKTSGNLSKY